MNNAAAPASIMRQMAVFLVPLLLSSILQSASATLNSIYVGRLLGVKALGAISVVFPLLFFLISFLIGLSSGSTILIGQAYGARNVEKLKEVIGTTITATLALSIVVGVLGVIFAQALLRLLGTPPDILLDATVYAQVFFGGAPAFFLFLVYTTFLRGTRDAKTPFYFLLLSAILSMLITPALILGWFDLPRLGVASAAVAGVASSAIAFVALLAYLRQVDHPLQFDRQVLAHMSLNPPMLAQVLKLGIPIGTQMVFVSLAEIAVVTFVNAFGSTATAAYGAVNQIASYIQFPAVNIGIAASIFGSMAIGAGHQERLTSIVRAGVALNYLVGVPLIIVAYLFAPHLLGWFITDPLTLAVAHRLMIISVWGYVVFGNGAVLAGLMRSSGAVVWPTAIVVASIWLVEVPLAFTLSHRIGLDGIWFAYPAAFIALLIGQCAYYFLWWKRRRHVALIGPPAEAA